jgi:hypothetical protein
MNRFSVIYLLKKQYYNIYCATHAEADSVLQQVSGTKGCQPIGVYDDKTELFYWEPTRQTKYDHATIEEQGKWGTNIIAIAQSLRHKDDKWQYHSDSISQLLSMAE